MGRAMLCGTRTTAVNGEVVPGGCNPYCLYGQLSRCPSLDGIILLLRARERDIVGNTVLENIIAAEKRLELLSEVTIRDAKSWDCLPLSSHIYRYTLSLISCKKGCRCTSL